MREQETATTGSLAEPGKGLTRASHSRTYLRYFTEAEQRITAPRRVE